MDDKHEWTEADEREAERLAGLPEDDPEEEIQEALANRTDEELEMEVIEAMNEADLAALEE